MARVEWIEETAISPDGKWVAYVRSRSRRAGETTEGRPRELFLIPAVGGQARLLASVERNPRRPLWSPDASSLAFIGVFRNFRRLYVVPAAGGALLARTEGPLGNMAWSPDGKWLGFIGATSLRDPAPQSVFVVPVEKGEAVDRTPGYEGSAVFAGWLDSDTMLFGAIEGTRTVINRVGAREGPIERLVGSGATSFTFIASDIDAGVSFDGSARTFAAPMSTATHPEEVYIGTTDGRQLARLTSHNVVLSDVRLARQERTEWKSADGLRIEGILFYPLEEKPERRYPLVVVLHAGPELAYLDANFGLTWPQSPAQLFAAHGYAVLAPNFRGSIGRGVVFARANQRDLGGRELDDVLSGIDHLVATGLVDSTRVAIHGQSHGGYLAALAAGLHAGRFKAAIASARSPTWCRMSDRTRTRST